MVTMVCCGMQTETVQESINLHPLDATTCAEIQTDMGSDGPEDMTDADVTADLDELSRPDVADDAWLEEMMGFFYADDHS